MLEEQDKNSLAPESKPIEVIIKKKRIPLINFLYKNPLFLIMIVEGLLFATFSGIAGLTCKTETSVKVFGDISNILWLVFSSVPPFIYVVITGKLKEGVQWCWFLGWTIMLYISGFLPGLLIAKQPELKHSIINSFPEPIAFTPIFILGWFPALIWCGIAYGIHSSIKMNQKSKKTIVNPEKPI